jgi:hypothetical protein
MTQRCQPVPRLGSCFMDLARAMGVLVCVCAVAQSQTAFVRVNQVGYVSGASKRAYLMASGVETGATFSIKNSSDTTVFGPAAIGANLGSWSISARVRPGFRLFRLADRRCAFGNPVTLYDPKQRIGRPSSFFHSFALAYPFRPCAGTHKEALWSERS